MLEFVTLNLQQQKSCNNTVIMRDLQYLMTKSCKDAGGLEDQIL